MEHPAPIARQLAEVLLAGPADVAAIAERAAAELGAWPPWLELLAMRVSAARGQLRSPSELAALVEDFLAARPELPSRAVAGARLPARARVTFPVRELATPGALAEWLELSPGQLAWMADVKGLERTAERERLRNYRYRTVPRRGGVPRLLEIPKLRLKEIQRALVAEILARVAPHPAAHGFTRGRSALTHASLHASREMVLSLDLSDFFASVPARRVFGIFHALGYPRAVAHLLTGLTTNVVPADVWRAVPPATDPRHVGAHFHLGRRVATPHLPQGAPTSPALANLAAFGFDRRIAALALRAGLRYSRYADDLVLSGPRDESGRHLIGLVAAIAREEGFRLHPAKTRCAGPGSRQLVCGIVVNAHPNPGREEYERLKAILHNAARDGPAGQNHAGVPDFEAHLRGRVAWIASLNPARGARLRRRLEAIDWSG
jgi:hypothetical protein